jgi:predicted metalloprotease with PDZ domain
MSRSARSKPHSATTLNGTMLKDTMLKSLVGALIAAVIGTGPRAGNYTNRVPQPSVAYTLRVDSSHFDVVDVTIRIEHSPGTLRLAMKVHPEYDAKYWQYLDPPWVDGTADDQNARVVRVDSTLWSATLPGGRGVVHYRIHVQSASGAARRAWQPFLQPTGGLVNSPDFFLYLPDFSHVPVSVALEIPSAWRIATALTPTTGPTRFTAPDAAAFLDAPILVGNLREWLFTDRGTRFHIVYWPLPGATPFDTVAFIEEVRRLTGTTLDLFGRAPTREFYFLLQDGAGDALEHRASVTLGIQSAALSRNPRASLTELAHEFFHTWNLVAIHPDTYGALSYRPPARTAGLWWGEGVTLYYADALPRRAGLNDPAVSRLDQLARQLTNYYAAPWSTRVSPEQASLAFSDSPIINPAATGGYYLQGELLGNELDALIRDSTHDARGLDDLMRAMFAASAGGAGFTDAELEHAADSVCDCRLGSIFDHQVRGTTLIDATPIVARLGLRILVDSVPAVDSTGHALPDLRLGADFTAASGPRLVIRNPLSVWGTSGLKTGDVLASLNSRLIATFADLQRTLNSLRAGDTAVVDVRRDGRPTRIRVFVTGYVIPRVRVVELAHVTDEQRARRRRWLAGW